MHRNSFFTGSIDYSDKSTGVAPEILGKRADASKRGASTIALKSEEASRANLSGNITKLLRVLSMLISLPDED